MQTRQLPEPSASPKKKTMTRVQQIVDGLVIGHDVPRELIENLLEEHRREVLSVAKNSLKSYGHKNAEISTILGV